MLVVILFLLLALYYGWIIFAFLQYRAIRQEEFLHVVTMAAATESPLARAMRAYIEDRPRSFWRKCWEAFLLFFVIPGYYWAWHIRHSYDRKVEKVVNQLEQGMPLFQALRAVPGVAPRESILVAAVGEKIGQLAPCLVNLQRRRLVSLWLTAAPRLLYPVLILFLVYVIVTFEMIFIIPKFQHIFSDFKMRLPPLTEFIILFGSWFAQYLLVLMAFLFIALIGLGTAVFASATFRWYFPILGYFNRRRVQGQVLSLLGTLLEAGQTIPQALSILIDSEFFQGTVLRRLEQARHQVEQGQSLTDSLYQVGFLPRAWVPLLHSAQRTGRLPQVLTELGDSRTRQVIQGIHRLTMAVFPLTVFLVGLLAAFFIIGLFVPLVTLINEMGR